MLNRELLISRLIVWSGTDDHEKLFVLRRELRGLSLTALAERYRADLEADPYDVSEEEPFLISTGLPSDEEMAGPLAVARMVPP